MDRLLVSIRVIGAEQDCIWRFLALRCPLRLPLRRGEPHISPGTVCYRSKKAIHPGLPIGAELAVAGKKHARRSRPFAVAGALIVDQDVATADRGAEGVGRAMQDGSEAAAAMEAGEDKKPRGFAGGGRGVLVRVDVVLRDVCQRCKVRGVKALEVGGPGGGACGGTDEVKLV